MEIKECGALNCERLLLVFNGFQPGHLLPTVSDVAKVAIWLKNLEKIPQYFNDV